MFRTQIEPEEVHLWWVNLREFQIDAHAWRHILSPAEQARAEKFRFPRDRSRHIISHVVLRMLLSGYVGVGPSALEFTTGARGKPELRCACGKPRIHFNLSHSRDVALYGFTRACPIGVDVEYLDPVPDGGQIARRFFSHAEAESLRALPEESRTHRFLELWTRKEALLKATGEGLAAGGPITDSRLPETADSGMGGVERDEEWHVRSFTPLPGYIGAVAYQKSQLNIICNNVPFLFTRCM